LPAFPASRVSITLEKAKSALKGFKKFCMVDLNLHERTAYDHFCNIRHFLRWAESKGFKALDKEVLREFLALYLDNSPCTRKNIVSAYRRFFRDYLGMPMLVESFKLPRPKRGEHARFKELWFTKDDLQRFYYALDETLNPTRNKLIFMLYCTTGLRRGEVLALKLRHIDFETRSIILDMQRGNKRTGITFYNEETEQVLRQFLRENPNLSEDERMFKISGVGIKWVFVRVSRKLGINPPLTPQALRVWFSYEMGKRGVPDRYIDIFQGRAPNSMLAQFYTPKGIRELKEVYDKARLTVLK